MGAISRPNHWRSRSWVPGSLGNLEWTQGQGQRILGNVVLGLPSLPIPGGGEATGVGHLCAQSPSAAEAMLQSFQRGLGWGRLLDFRLSAAPSLAVDDQHHMVP